MKNKLKLLILFAIITLYSCKKEQICYKCTKDNHVTTKCENQFTNRQMKQEIKEFEDSYGWKCTKIR